MKNSRTQSEDWEVRHGATPVHRREADHAHAHDHSGSGSGSGGPLIKISVSHGPSRREISVPVQSTFGHMKQVIEQEMGLDSRQQKILFRGKEKEDGEYLHEAGVKDNSKVLVFENPASKHEEMKESEETLRPAQAKEAEEMPKMEVKESKEMSKAFQAIAQVREEVDKLAERVSALEVAVNSGTKVADEEFVVPSELLMRQLLKLDTIEAEGEAKIQRKAEVRRVQNFHELLDNLKSSNSKPFSNNSNAMSVTTEWETFDSGVGSLSPPPVSSSTRITQDWERFD